MMKPDRDFSLVNDSPRRTLFTPHQVQRRQRRIKCKEGKPTCNNCTKFNKKSDSIPRGLPDKVRL